MARVSIVTSQTVDALTVTNTHESIWLEVGGTWLYLSREEAAQLAVDLLNAADAVPVEAGESA